MTDVTDATTTPDDLSAEAALAETAAATVTEPAPVASFSDFAIHPDIVDALAEHKITSPFPIQAMTLPVALSGHDIIGQAKTGTGKTLGFGIPVVQRLGLNPAHGVKALIVVPTRELRHPDPQPGRLAQGRGVRDDAVRRQAAGPGRGPHP